MSAGMPVWLAAGRGGTPLVMLHGMGSTASIWLPQLEYFARERLAVAWTMPGYGWSPASSELTWPALAKSLHDMLDALDIEQAHVLGHSIGGMIAQEFYHQYPDRVKSLVLSATSAAFGSRDPAWKENFLNQRIDAMRPYADFAEAAPELLAGFIKPDTSPRLRALASLSASPIQKEAYLNAMRLLVTFDRSEEFSSISVPILLLAGEHDTQAPPKGMQRLAQANANARFEQLPGLRHMANIEAPHLFNQTVETFLTA